MGKDSKRLGRGLNSLISRTVAMDDGLEAGGGEERLAGAAAGGQIAKPKLADLPPEHGAAAESIEVRYVSPPPPGHRFEELNRSGGGVSRDPAAPVDLVDRSSAPCVTAPVAGGASSGRLVALIDELVPHIGQPRESFNVKSIAKLAASIERQGVIQPLIVRRLSAEQSTEGGEAQYEIVAGERRWRAARAAGLQEVPVIIQDIADDQALEIALVENIQREDLNAIDRAKAYRKFCDQFGVTADVLAQRLGEDRTTVLNYMRLLELPDSVKGFVAEEQLSMGHARCLLGVADEGERVDLARAAVTNSLSVRALEDIVRRRRTLAQGRATTDATPPPRARSANVVDLESRLQRAVGSRVTIRESRRKGKGRIVIEYYSLDDFDRITGMLGLKGE